jgi:hypothetical protein
MKRPEIKSERYESLRKWMLNKKYKLTPEEYKRILDEQKGVCKICGKKQEKWWVSELNGGLSIDHHHSCGRVRGLLCSNCNTAIGLLCEDTKIMRRAIQYIKNSCCDDATIGA